MYIDFHTHTFPEAIALKTLKHLSTLSHTRYFTEGSPSSLSDHMKKNGVDYSINLPVATYAAQVPGLNDKLLSQKEDLFSKGIITFGAMHPDFEDYRSQLKFLADNGIKGIKLHPAYQNVDFDDIRFIRIMYEAESLGLIVTIHSGMDIGIPGHDFSSCDAVLKVLKEVSPTRLVLAHMGGWASWDKVETYLCGAPLYMDTSFSIGPLYQGDDHTWPVVVPEDGRPPYEIKEHLTPGSFERMVRSHGPERILFASDSPWSDQGETISLIEQTGLPSSDKELIYSENARKLLGI